MQYLSDYHYVVQLILWYGFQRMSICESELKDLKSLSFLMRDLRNSNERYQVAARYPPNNKPDYIDTLNYHECKLYIAEEIVEGIHYDYQEVEIQIYDMYILILQIGRAHV